MPILIDKPIGWTPLQALDALREHQPELKDAKLAYAGRLDPLASGLMLVLVDEECKQRDRFQNLDKTYEFKAILGFETDTYDIMGLPKRGGRGHQVSVNEESILAALEKLKGTQTQFYPPFSSKTVDGRPLYAYARAGKIPQEIPSKQVEVKSLELLTLNRDAAEQIRGSIHNRISCVTGDFRQVDILSKWDELLLSEQEISADAKTDRDIDSYINLHLRASVSSGTYIRGLVHELGKLLGTGAVAYDIRRTQVGEYDLNDALSL
jgi:tRNA pseudouridine55 synthase